MPDHGYSSRPVRRVATIAAAAILLLSFGASAASAGPDLERLPPAGAAGIVHARGLAGTGQAAASPNMTWHGGPIITSTVVKAIFWGSSWGSPGDKISGIDAFYGGVGNTGYMRTNTEYTGSNGQVGSAVSYAGHVTDLSAAPRKAPRTSAVLAEVKKLITNPVANGYYPVYIDQPRGHAGYCAWHSWDSINGVPVQFGFFFKLDGDSGCDPQNPSGTDSQGLEALANVTGHELSEFVTDPRGNAWYDGSGAENADKCAWTFGGNVSFGGHSWKVQGNWSNAAYDARSGYDGGGCIQTR